MCFIIVFSMFKNSQESVESGERGSRTEYIEKVLLYVVLIYCLNALTVVKAKDLVQIHLH